MRNKENEINRLNFEDWLFIIIIVLTIVNIFSDQLQKKYILTNNKKYIEKSTELFIITLIIAIFIYLYFVKRNYNLYKQSSKENKMLFGIKLLGSILIVVGTILLLYFQINDSDFIGPPAI